jgi:hypothetical protein|nr:MAG TPA: hypothetical protein [Ackermannviridae sp.]
MIEHAEHFILNTSLTTFENRVINHFRFGFLMKLSEVKGGVDGSFREAAYDNIDYLMDTLDTSYSLILYNLMWMRYAEHAVDILTPEKIIELGVRALRRRNNKQMGRFYRNDFWQIYLAVFCELEDYLRRNSKIEITANIYRDIRDYPHLFLAVQKAIKEAKKKYNAKRK